MRALAVAALALALPSAAQERPPADPLQQQAEALLERFHRVMPRHPAELRAAAVRRAIAPDALPLLREIRAFVAANPGCSLGSRGLEFTLYGLVLGDEPAEAALRERSRAGDVSAQLLLDCSTVIRAADAKERAAAIDAVAANLRDAGKPAMAAAATSGTFCLTIAADLSEAEAKVLAKNTADAALARQFDAVAKAAAKDARRLLDKPFELSGRLLAGKAFSTTSLRGKVVLVDFWATWCGPCVRVLPQIVALRRQYGAQGLEVVGVSSDRDEAALARFLAGHPEVDWLQLFEPGQQGFHPLAEGLGVTAIPRLFLIDKKGVLRCVDADENTGKLDAWIVRLLAE